jgi:protein-S-isoprenylcysteine O-methyltransferase Ste14
MAADSRQRYRRARVRDALVYWLYIPTAVIGGGKAADLMLGLPALSGKGWTAAALPLLAAGGWFIQRSTADLQRLGEGTPNPRFPPRQLVTGGVYSLCRHPMFFGYDLAALGVVLLFRSPGMLFLSYPAFHLLQLRFLLREERILHKRFGRRFEEYRQRVPMLMPRSFGKGKTP